MDIEIALPADLPKQSLLTLKEYIDKASIDGIDKAEIGHAPSGQGEMGAVIILHSIKVIIQAAQKPLIELVKCLQKYVDNYRTTITIPTKTGKPIVLEHGRSMTADDLIKLVTSIQELNP